MGIKNVADKTSNVETLRRIRSSQCEIVFYLFVDVSYRANVSLTAFVKGCFSEYYKAISFTDTWFKTLPQREFGFIPFDGGWMNRHKSFGDRQELEIFLSEYVPRDSYVSCAYYEDPEAEMEKKGWIGTDLTFDIDADHFATDCNKIHDEWICSVCSFGGKGVTPERCPACGSEKFNVSTWPCEVCLEGAKHETMKLLDLLVQDLGFSAEEIHLFFSGHRGYHVQIDNKVIEKLTSSERKEIADYVLAIGLDFSFFGLEHKPSDANTLRKIGQDDIGWRKRIATGILELISISGKERLIDLDIGKKEAKTLMANKPAITAKRNGKRIGNLKGIGQETWSKLIVGAMKSKSANIDSVVTTDIHRLIRLQGTLHGKTGLKKTEFSVSELESFDPLSKAVAFHKGSAKVAVSTAPKFRLGDEVFGPFKNSTAELSLAAALMLICKGRGEVVNDV